MKVEVILWGRKLKKQLKKKCVGNLRGAGLCIWVGNNGTDTETVGEDTGSREQLGSENM